MGPSHEQLGDRAPRARWRRALGLFGAWLLLGAWALAPATLPQDRSKENAVLSALILKMCRYTTWPHTAFKSEDEKLVIGVWKDDDIYRSLNKLARKKDLTIDITTASTSGTTTHPRGVSVLRLEVLPKPEEIDVLVISGGRKKDLDQIGKLYGDQPILSIGLDEDMAKHACILSVFIEDRSFAYQASTKNAKAAQLEINSSVLRNAKEVFKK